MSPVSSASGMNVRRREHAARGMLPAHERLDAGDRAGLQATIGW